ncbi:hypothetical protein DPMN_077274 [Dreissena polymorpha]|uniref:Uncharacterized protein n=1 Tax=Dreissena polymorpha TaxID=45954 RepID=A0A9D3YNJ4_DREPO|nr:hypothetical protein DPMN_077274 [Dreissena polymorpha]
MATTRLRQDINPYDVSHMANTDGLRQDITPYDVSHMANTDGLRQDITPYDVSHASFVVTPTFVTPTTKLIPVTKPNNPHSPQLILKQRLRKPLPSLKQRPQHIIPFLILTHDDTVTSCPLWGPETSHIGGRVTTRLIRLGSVVMTAMFKRKTQLEIPVMEEWEIRANGTNWSRRNLVIYGVTKADEGEYV